MKEALTMGSNCRKITFTKNLKIAQVFMNDVKYLCSGVAQERKTGW